MYGLFNIKVYSTSDDEEEEEDLGAGLREIFHFSLEKVLEWGCVHLRCMSPKEPPTNNGADTETQVNTIMINTHSHACTYTLRTASGRDETDN